MMILNSLFTLGFFWLIAFCPTSFFPKPSVRLKWYMFDEPLEKKAFCLIGDIQTPVKSGFTFSMSQVSSGLQNFSCLVAIIFCPWKVKGLVPSIPEEARKSYFHRIPVVFPAPRTPENATNVHSLLLRLLQIQPNANMVGRFWIMAWRSLAIHPQPLLLRLTAGAQTSNISRTTPDTWASPDLLLWQELVFQDHLP